MSDPKIIKIFANIDGWGNVEVVEEYFPKPLDKMIPQWWKDMPAYGGYGQVPENDSTISIITGSDMPTIKRCVPVLDALRLGYGIITTQEMYIRPYTGELNINDASCPQEEVIMEGTMPKRLARIPCLDFTFHDYGQAINHPYCKETGQRLQKVFTPWRIMTPPGYSVIIVEPLNNPSPYWKIIPGVIDSDGFSPQINFMMTINDPNFNGVVPAGTMLAQVFPFKRETWQSYVSDSIEDRQEIKRKEGKIFAALNSVFHAPYKKIFWSRKEFK
jgi:hypothetical protein